MINVVGINFDGNSQIYYFNPGKLNLRINNTVIVDTERGLQYGKVILPNFMIKNNKIPSELKNIIRKTTKKDYLQNQKNIDDANSALEKCKEIIKNLKLDMQVLDASFTFDRNQLLFRFISETRVDFRDLAKELATIYKTRIELRQVGVRDKAKEIGGCGLCGCKLCCSRFNSSMSSVSINMAKNQNLSLNPDKINGVCGRLMCCLKYENQNYKEMKKNLPKIGSLIQTSEGTGKVKSVNVLKESYTVEIKDKGIVVIGSN